MIAFIKHHHCIRKNKIKLISAVCNYKIEKLSKLKEQKLGERLDSGCSRIKGYTPVFFLDICCKLLTIIFSEILQFLLLHLEF